MVMNQLKMPGKKYLYAMAMGVHFQDYVVNSRLSIIICMIVSECYTKGFTLCIFKHHYYPSGHQSSKLQMLTVSCYMDN